VKAAAAIAIAIACAPAAAQDRLHFLDGRSESAWVSETTNLHLVLRPEAPGRPPRTLERATLGLVEFGRRPEMDSADSAEGIPRIDALRRVWYLLRPSVDMPESPAGDWGLRFAESILESDLPDNVQLSFEVFRTIEQRDWNRSRRHAARRGRFNAMLNLGLTAEALAEARKVHEDPAQEDPELLILARVMLGDLAFRELKALEQEHPRWELDDKVRPQRNRLLDSALDHYFFPHLYHGDRPAEAARGLWAAIGVLRHTGDEAAARARARDLLRLYPGDPREAEARALAGPDGVDEENAGNPDPPGEAATVEEGTPAEPPPAAPAAEPPPAAQPAEISPAPAAEPR
jgi:hypothetical protein